MAAPDLSQRLSHISTLWTMVLQAHGGPADAATAAQRALMERYSGAAFRYLLGAVRDPDTAGELAQEFALRFLRGDFRRADPGRGRFRDYLKKSLIHLIVDFKRAQQASPRQLADAFEPAVSDPESMDSERSFLTSWRQELLDRTWKALAEVQRDFHAALLFRVENPDVPSAKMAEQLSGALGKSLTAAWVRKALQRGHEKFAELLIAEVAISLEESTPEKLRAELQELDLLKYCRSALGRRGQ